MEAVLNDESEINRRIHEYPTSAIMEGGADRSQLCPITVLGTVDTGIFQLGKLDQPADLREDRYGAD